MLNKKWATFILTVSIMLVLALPMLAQDETATPEPTASATLRPTMAATTDLFVSTQYSRVNVRSGPAINNTIIGTLTLDDSLDITGKNEAADWLRVNFNGQEGWVYEGVIDINGDIEPVPVVEASAPVMITPAAEATEEMMSEDMGESDEVVIVTLYNTNLRSSFSTDSEVLNTILFDTEIVPEGRTDDSNWLMVTVDDLSGWVYAPIVFFSSGDVETLPVLATVPVEATLEDSMDTMSEDSMDATTPTPSE